MPSRSPLNRLVAGCLAACAALIAASPALADAGAGRWYAVQLHAHSKYSDGFHHIDELVRWAKDAGLDAVAVTDHNTRRHLADPAFAKQQDVLLIPGYEWTSHGENDPGEHGHANVWGLGPDTPVMPAETPYRKMLAQAAEQGVVVGINHPLEPRFPWPLEDLGEAQAMEVWHWHYHLDEAPGAQLPANARRRHHNWSEFLVRNARAIGLWEEALRRGQRITPVAVADFHVGFLQRLESPCTLVWSEEKSVDGLLAGLRAGRVILAESPASPRVELWADGDDNGSFESLTGDTVGAGSRVEVRVRGGKGLRLRVFDADGQVLERRMTTDDYREVLTEQGQGFVWARLDADHFWNPLKAMTGALYLRP